MLNWLKKVNPSLQRPTAPGLPNPEDTENPRATAAANREVAKVIAEMAEAGSRKRKRGNYGTYTPEQRAKIAKLCISIGPQKTADRMSAEVSRQLNESTVRYIKDSFNREVKRRGTNSVDNLPRQRNGRPLKLGDLDGELQQYLRNLRHAGGVVNRLMVMGAARGLVIDKDRSKLDEYGGNIIITKQWANSFLRRMKFVKRKGTKAARKVPEDFELIREQFYQRIEAAIRDNNIPDEMVCNWDQTGVNIVPVSDWTLEEEGTKQVPITGLEDKRQITLLLTTSLSGQLLPPQALYQGKTDACHPKFKFPEEWDIFHTESHWSNGPSMLRYADRVLIPYMEDQRSQLGLAPDHPGLAIFDVFKAHRNPALLEKLKEANIIPVFVPASCTGQLQPLDADGGINDMLKRDLTQSFVSFYGDCFAKERKEGRDLSEVKVDLKLTTLKPLHANWLLGAFDRVKDNSAAIERGWERTGIRAVAEKARR
uniref:DDE-1 domain-containing protein n=1 Tax=Branchiostoma floridae TaxID=7739 RepID=C3XZ48_BRAFL|eukprot:XP_002610602.1 hypothetical protein BRAFLDRAFT_65792 [Branchiostoma floridae]